MRALFLILSIMIIFPGIPFTGNNLCSQTSISNDTLKEIEKSYLHLDRSIFYPGDDIWFRAYLIDSRENQLTDNSGNLRIELISPGLKIIGRQTVKLTGGLGNGDFHLPDTLPSGTYQLRAYTNYMLNFSNELFFRKEILIINAADAQSTISPPVEADRSGPEVRFFPEGGSLVAGVPSVIAFKAANADGYATDVTGDIYSSEGEKITSFRSTHNGMGKFNLEPVTGQGYYAVISPDADVHRRYELPESFPSGIVLNLSENNKDGLSLVFRTNQVTFADLRDRDLYLSIARNGITVETYSFRMKSLNSFIHIPGDHFADGVYMVTLSDQEGKPVCERLIFISNNDNVKIRLEADKPEYLKRDSVSVRLSLENLSAPNGLAFLSLSAADDMFTDKSFRYQTNISSWFLLESDIRGPVENASYYFDAANPHRLEDLDLLLLTQGWRDFEWKYNEMGYPAEHGFSVSGRVRKKFADVPVPNSTVTIGIFGNGKPMINCVPTDSSGKFYLGQLDFTGKARLVASITDEKDNMRGWLLLDSTDRNTAGTTGFRPVSFPDQPGENTRDDSIPGAGNELNNKKLAGYIQYSEYKESVRRKYKLSDTVKLGEVKVTARKIYETSSAAAKSRQYLRGTPDRVFVVPKDYRGYSTAYQLISARFVNPLKLPWGVAFRMQYPLYIVDGFEVTEDDVKALPTNAVERIDIIEGTSFYASFGPKLVKRDTTYSQADGAVSIILRSDYLSKTDLHSVGTTISGFNEPRIFYSPVHHSSLESDYKPDLRTTLYWNPDIRLESGKELLLNYYNSDNSSLIKVTAEGITSTGIPVTSTIEYEVK